jgi:hypothetical protein
MLSDTSPDAERVQIELLRRASVAERAACLLSMSDWTIELSRRGIQQATPGLSDEEVGLRFVELHYGRHLAEEVRAYLRGGI